MMTDMRDPLTVAFHRARHRADLLRPNRSRRPARRPRRPSSNTATRYTITSARSTSRRPRRCADGAATSRLRTRSASPARRACCGWPRTPRPLRRASECVRQGPQRIGRADRATRSDACGARTRYRRRTRVLTPRAPPVPMRGRPVRVWPEAASPRRPPRPRRRRDQPGQTVEGAHVRMASVPGPTCAGRPRRAARKFSAIRTVTSRTTDTSPPDRSRLRSRLAACRSTALTRIAGPAPLVSSVQPRPLQR